MVDGPAHQVEAGESRMPGPPAALFRVLGDPRRLGLPRLLAAAEGCMCEFQELLGWQQTSFHITWGAAQSWPGPAPTRHAAGLPLSGAGWVCTHPATG
jgi:hypothetical protein